MTLLGFLFFLSLLILVHELGHFFMARKSGAQVEEFSLGFPPKIFSRSIKKTNYSLGLILFGGYVKLKGEDNPKDPEGFWALSPQKRLLIILGGILFNVLLAYFLFFLSLTSGYPVESKKIFVSGFLSKNSLAAQKFKIGDEILAAKFNEKFFQFKNVKELSDFLKEHRGQEVIIVFKRDNQVLEEKVIPPVGFYLANFELKKEPVYNAVPLAFFKTFENFKKIIYGFYKVLLSPITKEKIDLEIVGPVGIYNLFDNFKNFGFGYLFYFIAILSLNLAFINALPFPALDGGRVLFILGEILLKRKLSYEKEEFIHRLGFVFLFSLLIVITLKDIYKLWFK